MQYSVQPRGRPTHEDVATVHRFRAGEVPKHKGFNPVLARALTGQIMSGIFDLEEIKRVAPNVRHELFCEVPSDYGPRLRWQLDVAINTITVDRDTRRAVCVAARPGEQPTTCIQSVQFLVRNNHLHTIAFMRSLDIGMGLAYDVHHFQAMGAYVANGVDAKPGDVVVMAGSAHVYQDTLNEQKETE